MMTLSPEVQKQLAEILAVANTPRFLYKKLKAHAGVFVMSEILSDDELVAVYENSATRVDRGPIDTAMAYAAVVALCLKRNEEAEKALEQLHAHDLRWIEDFRAFRLGEAPVHRTVVTAKPTWSRVPTTHATGEVQHTIIAANAGPVRV